MSRAFVKEGTGELEPLPDLPISAHPNYVTPRGMAALRARLLARQGDLAVLRGRAERLDKLPEAAAERGQHEKTRVKSPVVSLPTLKLQLEQPRLPASVHHTSIRPRTSVINRVAGRVEVRPLFDTDLQPSECTKWLSSISSAA